MVVNICLSYRAISYAYLTEDVFRKLIESDTIGYVYGTRLREEGWQ